MTSLTDSQSRREWTKRAGELAKAAIHLLNRDDCCGGYRPGHPTTRKETDRDWEPMPAALRHHFAGMRPIGLHTTTTGNMVRWLAFDIDAHGTDDVADANHATALTIAGRLRSRGLTPYVFDSNGRGGYHVWAVLLELMASENAYALAQEIADGFAVETFPKQARVREGGFGNWIRLPGKHHKRYHWSRLWTDRGWASAKETVAAVIAMALGVGCEEGGAR